MKALLKLMIFTAVLVGVLSMAVAQRETVPAAELADPNGQFITVNDTELYYIEHGAPDDPALLLLHGFGASTFTWRDNIEALDGYRVVAFDRPPYGLADKSPDLDYSNETYAELTAGLMDALEIERAVLVGHSAGGGVIATFALMYPERVEGLVFVAGAVDIAGAQTEESEGTSVVGEIAGAAQNLDPDSPLSRIAVRTLLTPERLTDILSSTYYDPDFLTPEISAGYQRPLQVEGWEGAFINLFTQAQQSEAFTEEELSAVEVPVLLLWGEHDEWVPLTVGENLQAIFPNVELMTYPETGHMPMEERTDQFNADLLDWLAKHYPADE